MAIYRIILASRGLSFPGTDQATLLSAAEQAGFRLPRSCTAGTCGICYARLLEGIVREGPRGPLTNSATHAGQEILSCLAIPQTDCIIEVANVLAPGEFPVSQVSCQVSDVRPLSPDIKQVILRLPAGKKILWQAGHYLEILLPDTTACPFSIANAPGDDRHVELHVRRTPDSALSDQIDGLLTPGNLVKVRLPKGRCLLPKDALDGPLLFIAGSTGFAPIKAMLEHCLRQGLRHPAALYWGGRQPSDIYLHDLAVQWAQQHPLFHYEAVVSEADADDQWQGRTGLVHQAVLADLPTLSDWRIVVGGSPPMVYAIYDDFIQAGMLPEQMMSDVFDYAPRPA